MIPGFYNHAAAITRSDTEDHPWVFDAFLVGAAGNVVLVLDNERSTTVTLTGLLQGHVYRIRGKRINLTNTTASSLVALKQI